MLTRLLSIVLIVLGPGLAITDSNPLFAADDELFAPMTSEKARAQSLDWAAGQGLKDPALIDAIGKLWTPNESQKRPAELHKLTIRTFSLAKPVAAELVKRCRFGIMVAPTSPILESDANEGSANEGDTLTHRRARHTQCWNLFWPEVHYL